MSNVLRTAVVCLVAGGMAAACTPQSPTSWDEETSVGPVGPPVETVANVEYYPACGNETVEVDGTTWFPLTPTDDSPLPADPLAATVGGTAAASGAGDAPAGMSRSAWVDALPRVVAPGPGDDIGTLVVYPEGLAYWRSHSGDLDTWLTIEPREYSWVC